MPRSQQGADKFGPSGTPDRIWGKYRGESLARQPNAVFEVTSWYFTKGEAELPAVPGKGD